MTVRRSIIGTVIALATALVLEAQPSERLTLGVMRRDGVIVPFASYDGDWSLSWPASIRNMEIPITLDAVPKKWWGGEMPATWTVWSTAGGQPVRLSPSAPIAVIVGREKRLGLRTSFVSEEPLPMPFELPYPKEGLAVAGDVKVEQVVGVSKLSAAWRGLTTTLRDDIEAAEHKAVEALKANARWNHPVPRTLRRTLFAELEAWYTSSLEQPGFGVSYIEAVKKYPPAEEDQGCGLETFVSGWIHTNIREAQPKSDLTARITYCDREDVSYMLPLGRLRLKNRTHWVFQTSSRDREWYAVVEATPGRVRFVAEYYAGGRPRLF